MTVFGRSIPALVMLAISASPCWSQEVNPNRDSESVAAEIDRCLRIIEVIHARHLKPPLREAMALAWVETVYEHLNDPVFGTARQLTGANWKTVKEWVRRVLKRKESQLRPETLQRTFEMMARRMLAGGVFERLPSTASRVQAQIAANRYVGIGIALGKAQDGAATMVQVIKGGPAAKAGAVNGTVIHVIDGDDVHGMTLRDIITRLRGPRGTKVKLVLANPKEEKREVSLTRDIVPFEMVTNWKRVDKEIGYLSIKRIGRSTAQELLKYEAKIREEKLKGLILDLSRCEPGTVHHAVLLADQLLENEKVGTVFDATGKRDFAAHEDSILKDVEIAIIVSRHTVGTAAWFAQAMVDADRAILVGSYGQGFPYVDEWVDVPGESLQVKLVTKALARANGKLLAQPRGPQIPNGATTWQLAEQFGRVVRKSAIPSNSRQDTPQGPIGIQQIVSPEANLKHAAQLLRARVVMQRSKSSDDSDE